MLSGTLSFTGTFRGFSAEAYLDAAALGQLQRLGQLC